MKHFFLRRVDEIIFTEHEIRSLQSLLREYKQIAAEYGFPVGKVKSSYVKDVLIKEYGDGIGFHERNEKNKSELVYDTKGGGNYIEAALNSFGITDEQLIHNLAPRLSKKIKEAPIVNWPPRIHELENDESMCQLILTLFSKLKPKRRNKDSAADESPVLRTLASLITYFVTGKRTSTAVNLAVLIHGMTRSRELIDLLHKCGLCISYTDLLLLYDAWALEDAEASETCPVGIAADKPPIVIVDNDDFKIDTLTGNADGAHRTNVLYVQPESYEEERVYAPETIRHTNKKEITKQLDEKCKKLTTVQQYMCPRDASREPPVRDRVCAPVNGPRPQRIRSVIHALVRADPEGERPSVENQTVPSYSGFQSCLLPSTRKSKPYYHATYNEPPKKSVMNDIMAKLVQTMGEKNMPFAFLVGDLPTYKLIVELKSENPNKYFDIVPTIGAFHQQMSFIYAIYKRFLGSGISELMVSAGVIVEGSVDQALRGKHYRRGLRCIMLWREALIHKRVNMFLENEYLSTSIKENMETLRNALHENKDNLASAYSDLETDEDIRLLVDAVYMKPSTDIGDYWLSFMEMSDILLQNVHACHVGNFDEYLSSTHDMLPGLLAYNNHDYGRWLPDYWAAMSSLPYEKKKFFSEHFSQSMTGLPYSCQPMDLWIEVTMNLNSKLKQGWLQLLQNDKQLFCTTRNANNVGRVKTLMKNNLNCQRRYQRHVECQPARMKKDERAVQDLLTCTDEFEADPFDNTLPDLRSLQSGVTASPEIQLDLQNALEEGKKQADDILEKRVFSKELILSATISKNKHLNLASTPVTTSAGSNCSIAEMEKIGLAALMDCAENNDLIDLETLLDRRVTEECLTMFNVNGSLRKTAKSKLLQSFSRQPQMEHPASYVGLVDMGLIWRLASPTSDDRDHKKRCGAEYTWQDYIDKVCSMVFSRHGNAEKLILINDNYTVSSIKDDEHDRRASKHTNIPNVYPKDSDKFPSPAQFKSIMMKSENKVRLQKLLKNCFRARIHDVIGEIIYCEGEAAENLTNGHENDDFVFEQAEADTMLLSAYGKLRDSYDGPVVIDSEDTDVYVQAAYVAHILPGNLYIKNKNSLFNCVELVSNSVSKVIVPFHVLTGCDHTSGFYGRGKKKIFDKLMKDSEGQELLREVGDSLILDENTRQNMKKFILWKVYGEHVDTCGKARASKWRKMKKKSMARLPPDEDTLNHHCDRTNYISFCLKHFELDRHPPPIGHGWAFLNGRCRPIRHTKSAMPEFVREFDPRPLLSDDSDSEYGESSDDSDSDQD